MMVNDWGWLMPLQLIGLTYPVPRWVRQRFTAKHAEQTLPVRLDVQLGLYLGDNHRK